jgi:hypothetical protein
VDISRLWVGIVNKPASRRDLHEGKSGNALLAVMPVEGLRKLEGKPLSWLMKG